MQVRQLADLGGDPRAAFALVGRGVLVLKVGVRGKLLQIVSPVL